MTLTPPNSVRLTAAIAILISLSATASADDFFKTRVAPIFEKKCLSCHNSLDHKGDFALQRRDELFDSGYVEAGDAAASHLLSTLVPETPSAKPSMPKDGAPLSVEQVAVIRQWIADGANWPEGLVLEEPVIDDFDWWSYQPIERPAVPTFDAQPDLARWVRSPIDAFVLQKLVEHDLKPSPEADRRTLIRRLTYDLTGLPPTPDEVDRFLADDQPQAYERLVNRLLESPRYGERWARHWLDVVRYADTCGYDKDKLRPNAWPYRDYVIRSLNDDKPYARFVQEQIAGDVLFPGEPDGILGLGFIAAGPWDFIGHVEVPESKIDGKVARNLDRDEMVSSTFNTFCSVTIQCARCHNHKFDPFTQQHYYGLQAVFAAVDRAERPYDLDPEIERQRRELNAQIAALQAEQKSIDEQIKQAGGAELADLEKRIAELKPKAEPQGKQPEFGYHSAIAPRADAEKWIEIDLGRDVAISKIVLRPCHDDYAGIGAGFGFPVRFRVELTPGAEPAAASEKPSSITIADDSQADVPNPGLVPFEIPIEPHTARHIRVTATKLAERKNDFIFALAELQVFDADGNNVARAATVTALDSIEAPVRWGKKNLTDGIFAQAADPQALEQLALATKQRAKVLAQPEIASLSMKKDVVAKRLADTRTKLAALPQGRMVYAAATHFTPQGNFKPTEGTPREIRLLHRGQVTQPKNETFPGALPLSSSEDAKFALDDSAGEGERREALARWITSHDNPLTWRSIVNRVWQYHFGRGIVASPNDFGRMGQLPTHPELLDWLATEFRDNGQSFKELHRLIVTSATYRQSSAHNEQAAAIDGSNQYLWRMDRRRLSAEEIRDSILAVSGKLDLTMGGPGYYLFVLEKTAHSPHYEYHLFDPEDPTTHRRSVYRFIVRSQPDPYMTTLDCADSSQSTPRRDETLTSLQALSLLNNRFSLSMSKHFAERLAAEHDKLPNQVDAAFRLVTGRSATATEREQLIQYAQQYGLPNLSRVLFNLSEFVFVD
ncbi:DUF1553 domain-containing protein [bacterium]|nr:DUF1553 domain-containing protein [bacterium]